MSRQTANVKPAAKKDMLHTLIAALKHLLLHNGWLKLIAVLISLILWAGLVSQDESLTRDRTFQNVNVSVTGSEFMKSNGYIVVSNLDEILDDVSFVAAVPQLQYENAEASAYSIRVDLSKINGTGEQELKLLSTNSSLYGKVTSITPSSVNVMVEEYNVRPRIPVSVSVEGEIPDGWYMSTPTVDLSLVAVGGPSSLVKRISRAKAFINTSEMEWKEGTIITSSAIKLYTPEGEEISSPLLGISSTSLPIDSVLIETTILPTLTFDVREMLQFSGSVARGYEIKDIKVSPETVTVAARREVLEQLTDLPMERTISLKNLNETSVFQLKVQKPSEEAVIIPNDTITVTVEIGPVEQD